MTSPDLKFTPFKNPTGTTVKATHEKPIVTGRAAFYDVNQMLIDLIICKLKIVYDH